MWFHALKVLDTFRTSNQSQDVFKLYEYEDNTGILENHKQHLKSMVSHDRLDVKTMYFELIKMLLDQDKNQSPEGFKQTRDVDRIQGFQELTNRLQFNLNEKYLTQICDLGQRLGKIEALLEGGDDNLFTKLDKLEAKLSNVEKDHNEKFDELSNAVADNATRLSTLESQGLEQDKSLEVQAKRIDDVVEDLRARDDSNVLEKMIQDSMNNLSASTLDTLSKRIDQNEDHIKLLETKDDDLESKIEDINGNLENSNGRLDALEKADEFLQAAYEKHMKVSVEIAEGEKSLKTDFDNLKDDFDHYKEDQDTFGTNLETRIETIKKDTHELQNDNEELKEKLEELEQSLDNTKTEVINDIRITQVKFEEKFENSNEDLKEKIEALNDKNKDLTDKLDEANENIKDHENKLEDIEKLRNSLSDTTDNLDNLKDTAERKWKVIDETLSNVENDLNGNKQKIEDANGVIKRHTEQIFELNDLRGDIEKLDKDQQEIKDDVDKVKFVSVQIKENINELEAEQKKLEIKDNQLHDQIHDDIIPKLINLEESNVIQQEKAVFITEKYAKEEEKLRQSSIDKEDLEEKLRNNVTDLSALKEDLDKIVEGLSQKDQEQEADIESLRSANGQLNEKLAEIGRENENLTDEVDHSKNHLNKLVDLLEQKLDDLANKAKDVKEEVDELSSSNGKSIKDLKHEINELFDRLADDEKDIKDLNDKVQDSVKVEIETLVSQVQDKLEDVDNKCQENEGHVTNLREVNRIALERIKENVQDDIEAHKELIEENKDLLDKSGKAINDLEAKIEELEKELGDLKSDEIDDLAKEQKEMKDKIEALDEQGKVLDEKLQNENNQMALMVQQIRVSQENTVREMRQEIIKVVPEDIDIQMLKETIDSLNDKYENATKQREELIVNIQNVDERYARGIEDMEERHGTEAKSATLRMESLGKFHTWSSVTYKTVKGFCKL